MDARDDCWETNAEAVLARRAMAATVFMVKFVKDNAVDNKVYARLPSWPRHPFEKRLGNVLFLHWICLQLTEVCPSCDNAEDI